jgi:hypothetical protein
MLLGACDAVVDIDTPDDTPVVVNCLFDADSTWSVRVMRAWAMGEPLYNGAANKAIDNAHVTITPVNGSPIALKYDTSGYYISAERPQPGTQYDLRVDVPGGQSITSSTMLLPAVTVDTAYVSGSGTVTVTVEFTDIPGPTWYEILVWSSVSGNGGGMQTDDPEATMDTYWIPNDDFGATLGPSYLVLSDRTFEGKKKVLKIIKTGFDNDVHHVVLRTLSGDYARYRATANKQQNIADDPFAQPVQVYSNIANGTGIFGGLSSSEYVIE